MPDWDRVFKEAQSVIRTFLREIDAQAPGLVTDVYITGSIALGEARPGRSDADIVLVRPDDVDDATVIQALEPILASLRETHPRPPLDGIVLSRSELAHGPDGAKGNRAVIFENRVQLSNGASARNPVTWQTLRQCGITWRGVPIAEIASGKTPVGSAYGRTKTWRSTGDPGSRGAKDCSPVVGCGPSCRISLSGACWE